MWVPSGDRGGQKRISSLSLIVAEAASYLYGGVMLAARRIFAPVLLISAAILLGACSATSSSSLGPTGASPSPSVAIPQSLQSYADERAGVSVKGPFDSTTDARCTGDYFVVTIPTWNESGDELTSASKSSAYAIAREGSTQLVQLYQSNSELDGYGFLVYFGTDDALDKYGNQTDYDFFAICYSSYDIDQINLSSFSNGNLDILDAGRVLINQIPTDFS